MSHSTSVTDRLFPTGITAAAVAHPAPWPKAGGGGLPDAKIVKPVTVRFTVTKFRVATVEWGRDEDGCHAPRHTLDIPATMEASAEEHLTPAGITNRDEALILAAALNDRATDPNRWGKHGHFPWCVVVELGEVPVQAALACIDFSGDAGIEEAVISRPIRLVRPTAAEVEKHAAALTWE